MKRGSSKLTIHGKERLYERTKLLKEELFEMLKKERCVILKLEEYTNKLHKLFFSMVDREHFVAIQDIADGCVVTVLTLEYYANLCGQVKNSKLNEATKKAIANKYTIDTLEWSREGCCDLTAKKRFRIHMVAEVDDMEKCKTVKRSFGCYRFKKVKVQNEHVALRERGFIDKILENAEKRGIDINLISNIICTNDLSQYCFEISMDQIRSM